MQGAFAALMAPAALSILTITFSHDAGERAKAFGAYGAVSGAGAAIGVLLGGVLTQFASWRWCLYINVPIALFAAVAASRIIGESRASGTTNYDIPGALLSTAGLVSLVYGFTKAVTDGWSSTPTLALISVGVVLLAAFVVVEARSTNPLLPLRIVLERNRGGSYLAATLLVVGIFAMFIFISYYFQTILGYSAAKAGVAFLPFALGVIVAAGAATNLLPKLGPRITMTFGLLLAAAGLLWLTKIGVHTSYWTHVCPQLIVMSLGMGLAFTALSSTALTNVRDRDSGVARPGAEFDSASRCVPRSGAPQHHRRHGDRHLPRISRTVTGEAGIGSRFHKGPGRRSDHRGGGRCRQRRVGRCEGDGSFKPSRRARI